MYKKSLGYLGKNWRIVLASIAMSASVISLMLFKLKSLVAGTNADEKFYLLQTANYKLIRQNPLYLPHKLITKLTGVDPRYVSVLFACLFLAVTYFCLRFWFTRRVAAFGIIITAFSTWFLHPARSGTPIIMLFGVLPIVVFVGRYAIFKNKTYWPWILMLATIATSFYVPGSIIIITLLIILFYRSILKQIKKLSVLQSSISIVLFFGLITPLMIAATKDPAIVKTLFLLPTSTPTAIEFLKHTAHLPYWLIYKTPIDYSNHLGNLSILDAGTILLSIFGIYYVYIRRQKWLEAMVLLPVLATISILIGVSDNYLNIGLILPLLCLVIASGCSFVLQQWQAIFPKNPYARTVSICLLLVFVGIIANYNRVRYFVAWPNTPETKQAYSVK